MLFSGLFYLFQCNRLDYENEASQQRMVTCVMSFLLGFFTLPLIYSLFPHIVSSFIKTQRFRNESQKKVQVSERLREEIMRSTSLTTDTAWLNVFIQRMFSMMCTNTAFEQQLRKIILKNFLSATKLGVVRSVRILKISMGKEAPFINSVRVLSQKEYEMLVAHPKSSPESDSLEFRCGNKTIQERNEPSEINSSESGSTLKEKSMYKAMNKNISLAKLSCEEFASKSKKPESIEFMENIVPEPACKNLKEIMQESILGSDAAKEIYRNFILVANIDYSGEFNLSLEIELPGKMLINSSILIKQLKGMLMLKLPADNYETRYEYSFVNEPQIEMDVFSGVGGKKKVFLQQSLSKLVKSTLLHAIKKMFVFPNWHSQYHWFIPSSKRMTPLKNIARISCKNDMARILNGIKIQVGLDYKIKLSKNGIFYRENKASQTVLGEFEIPDNFSLCSAEEFQFFEDLSVSEARILSACSVLSPFKGVFSRFTDMRVSESSAQANEVVLEFKGVLYQFIRILSKDFVAFYRNHPDLAEFFIFKISSNKLQVFSCGKRRDYSLNFSRIVKLKSWIYGDVPNNIKLDSSAVICKPNIDQAPFTMNNTDIKPDKNNFSEIEELSKSTPYTNQIVVPLQSEILMDILDDHSVRMVLFASNGRVYDFFPKSDQISSLLITFKGEENKGNEMIVFSYRERTRIIDANLDNSQFYIYEVSPTNKGSILKMKSSSKMDSIPEELSSKLKIRIAQAVSVSWTYSTSFSRASGDLRKELKTMGGSLFFEFSAPLKDDFHFKVFSCKHTATVFEIRRIVSGRPFRLIIPVERDFLRVTLTSKYGMNQAIEYKLMNLQDQNDILVSGTIELKCNERLTIPFQGLKNHKIYWEINPSSEIKAYLAYTGKKLLLDSQGILPVDSNTRKIIFKNKGKKRKEVCLIAGEATID